MFNRLRTKFKKRLFANTVVLELNKFLFSLFDSTEYEEKYTSIRILKKRGEDEIQAFKEEINEIILEVVQSDNPHIAMRKALISNIKNDSVNRLLWTEEFNEHRQVIYDAVNEYGAVNEYSENQLSDKSTGSSAVLTEAESICLRYLQLSMFEKDSENGWWSTYVKLYEEYTKHLYRSILAKENNEKSSTSPIFLNACSSLVDDFEQKILKTED